MLSAECSGKPLVEGGAFLTGLTCPWQFAPAEHVMSLHEVSHNIESSLLAHATAVPSPSGWLLPVPSRAQVLELR